jgi:glycerol uptake facilitator-like aquaporin
LNTTPGDQFGSDVGISGSTIVVGAADSEGLRGTAYVFAKTGSSWIQIAELNPADTIAKSFFGTSVAISGTTIVVGGTSSCRINPRSTLHYALESRSVRVCRDGERLAFSDGLAPTQ